MTYKNIRNLFNRMESLSLIFWIAILLIIFGIFLPILEIFIWIGCFIVLIYIVYFVVWLSENYG